MKAVNDKNESPFSFLPDGMKDTAEMERKIWEAIRRCSKTAKLSFDFPGEPILQAGRKTRKAESAIYDLARGLTNYKIFRLKIFPNALGTVTVSGR